MNNVDYTKKYDIFLSYRRDGGEHMAKSLCDSLKAKGYRVFLDIEDLKSGSFNTRLYDVIDNCKDFIIICSKGSLDRCKNEDDWVRLEAARALLKGKNIVPVMLRNFKFPEDLPADIKALEMKNGVNANDREYYDAMIDRLAKQFLTAKPGRVKYPEYKSEKNISVSIILMLCFIGIMTFVLFGVLSIQDSANSTVRIVFILINFFILLGLSIFGGTIARLTTTPTLITISLVTGFYTILQFGATFIGWVGWHGKSYVLYQLILMFLFLCIVLPVFKASYRKDSAESLVLPTCSNCGNVMSRGSIYCKSCNTESRD